MLTQAAKITIALFFLFIAMDSFFKMKKIRIEVQDQILNPLIGKTLRRRALRHGIQFLILALLSIATLWIKVGPLAD